MSVGSRMKERRESLGMTQVQLADLLGVTKGAIGNYETDANSPKASILYKVFEVLQCDANYLFQDEIKERRAYTASPAEMEHLVKRYRSLDAYGQEAVDGVLDVEWRRCRDEEAAKRQREAELSGAAAAQGEPRLQPKLIPLFDSPAAAGYASPVMGEGVVMFEPPEDAPEQAQLAIRIRGDSMEPYIEDGSIVYIERAPLEVGDLGIFYYDGDTFCKQYYKDKLGMVYLFSLNRARSDADIMIPASSNSTFQCFGRVITKQTYPLPSGAQY